MVTLDLINYKFGITMSFWNPEWDQMKAAFLQKYGQRLPMRIARHGCFRISIAASSGSKNSFDSCRSSWPRQVLIADILVSKLRRGHWALR
jgi:hypothetical protein